MTSTAESTNDSPKQTPTEEILDRVAENWPAMHLPRWITIDHLQKSLASARSRVNDSHRSQVETLNKVTGNNVRPSSLGDEMGGINVAGDTNITNINPEPKKSAGLLAQLLPLALASLLGAGGMYYWASQALPSPTPKQPVFEESDWQLGLEVKNTP